MVLLLAFSTVAALAILVLGTGDDGHQSQAQGEPQIVISPPPTYVMEGSALPADEDAAGSVRAVTDPDIREFSTGLITGIGSVSLEWTAVPEAESYAVKVYNGSTFSVLPALGASIEFSGSSAQITGLPNYVTYYFLVRAENAAGSSGWSGLLILVNDTSNLPAATATATAAATASPPPTLSPTPTPVVVLPPTATATPATTGPRSCRSLARSQVTRSATSSPTPTPSPTPCDFPVMGYLLSFVICQFEEEQRSGEIPLSEYEPIAISIGIAGSEQSQSVVEFLTRHGVEYDTLEPVVIRGGVTHWVWVDFMPLSLVVRVSQISGVKIVEMTRFGTPDDATVRDEDPEAIPQIAPTQVTTSLTTNAAAMHGADAWHRAGIDGKGVKIGIIDRSFKDFSAFRGENLDIPATVTAQCFLGDPSTNLPDGFSDHCDKMDTHGTEVAMAVMDVAPGAELFLALSHDRRSGVQDAADWMRENDVDVINLSVSFPWEAGGDGVSVSDSDVLQAVEDAVASGIVWVNSAGNWATAARTFHANVSTENVSNWDDSGWLIFDHGTNGDEPEINNQHILQDLGRSLTELKVRWGGDSDTEVDLYACADENCNEIFGRSARVPGGSRTFEHLPLFRDPESYFFRVCNWDGESPDWIQIGITTDRPLEYQDGTFRYWSKFGSVRSPGESSSGGLLAVGAARRVVASDDTVSLTLEDDSSRGPSGDPRQA